MPAVETAVDSAAKSMDSGAWEARRVVVTGAGGLIGGILLEALGDRYEVVGVDRRRERRAPWTRADLTNPKAAARVLEAADVVVDLAADPSPTLSWEQALANNIPTTFNVFEAARLAEVRRIVYASSNHVTGMYEADEPYASIVDGCYERVKGSMLRRITASDPVRPDGPYGLGKAFGEAAGRYFSDRFGLSVLCLRIGSVNRADRPTTPRHFATLLTHGDLVRLVDAAITAPLDRSYGIFYGVSANTWRFWDIEDAREAIDYLPHDDAEGWR